MADAIVKIRELNLNDVLPNVESMKTDRGGPKILIIGKPGTGKSIIIKSLLYAKRNIIPVAMVVSGTESTNKFFHNFIPSLFIYDELNKNILLAIKSRQNQAKNSATVANSWSALVLDDCMDNTKMFKSDEMNAVMKNGRHWNMMTIISTQYMLDLGSTIRGCFDGIFIMKESNAAAREKLHKHYATIIPTKDEFNKVMDELTTNYTAVYIDSTNQSNDWSQCVYYYKADKSAIPEKFRFGCPEYWKYAIEKQLPELVVDIEDEEKCEKSLVDNLEEN